MNMRHFSRSVVATVALAAAAPVSAQCTGDIVGDGRVDGADLGTLLAYWGPRTNATFSIASDLDNDGQIDGADLGILLANWGACPLVPWANIIEIQPDPAVVTDPTLRAAIVATGLPWRVRDRGTGIEMLLIPPGTFQMGCIMGSNLWGCVSDEQPVHQVTLTNPFYLGRYEVTQAQWTAKMGSNPSWFQMETPEVPAMQISRRPVEQVSWNAIQGYLSATGMRLPTEAEWEYACRAGTQTPFYNGSTDDGTLSNLMWYVCCQTFPVGGKAANGFGLHDMLGNVWEWVNDRFGDYAEVLQVDPMGPGIGSNRVIRGGCFAGPSMTTRSSYRDRFPPTDAVDGIGFRAARNP